MQNIFLLLALGIMLIGCIAAFRRSMGERLCLFASIPLSFLIAFLITKAGAFDAAAEALMPILMSSEDLASILNSSSAAAMGVSAIISSIIRPFAAVVIFWIIALILRIVINIVLKHTALAEKCSFFAPTRGWKCAISCFISALCCLCFALLSYLPIASIENIVKPTVEDVKAEEYDGTYVQHLASVVNDNFLPTGEGSVYGFLHKYTGIGSILSATVDSLSTHTLTDNSGKEVELNSAKLLRTLVRDGAEAMVIYEYTCNPDENTVGSLSSVSDIVRDIASMDALLTIVVEVIGTEPAEAPEGETDEPEAPEEGGEIALAGILDTLKGEYLGGDISSVKNDLNALASTIDVITGDLSEASLADNAYVDELFRYLSDADSATKVVDELSKLTIYEDVFDMLMEYGIGFLCDILDLSRDNEEHYGKFLDSLYEAANKRDEGEFDILDVSQFIAYAAESGIKPSEYVTSEEYTALDIAYISYKRYIDRSMAFESVFTGFGLDDPLADSVFYTETGVTYIYKAEEDLWYRYSDVSGTKSSSLASQLLAVRTADVIAGDLEYTITVEDIKTYAEEISDSLDPDAAVIYSAFRTEQATTILSAIISADSFEPENAIYVSDVVAGLKKGIGFDESANKNFGIIIASAFDFLDKIMGESVVDLNTIMDNFHLVGRLLDCLQNMEKTEQIPASLLKAITQHKEYGKYFLSDSIEELTQNVANGTSTYEELFVSVRALYGIINQIVPTT